MNLKNLSDQQLLESAKTAVRREREAKILVIEHIREIDRRRLFSGLKYESLAKCVIAQFYYTEDEAYRRINAMKLLRDFPEIKEQIESGSLGLTVLQIAKALFKAEARRGPLTTERKREILKSMEGKTIAQARLIAHASVPEAELCPESMKVRATDIDLRLVMPLEFQALLEEAKGMLAHSHPGISTGELYMKLLRDLIATKTSAQPRKGASFAQVRRDVMERAQGKCECCGSTYALQFDHIKPKALGGEDTAENLRLVCRNCNQRAAIVNLGLDKMEPFFTQSSSEHAQARDAPEPSE